MPDPVEPNRTIIEMDSRLLLRTEDLTASRVREANVREANVRDRSLLL